MPVRNRTYLVDVSQIDSEITQSQIKIEQWLAYIEAEKDVIKEKEIVRNYIVNNGSREASDAKLMQASFPIENLKQESPEKNSNEIGMRKFIVNFIKGKEEVHTSEITKAYAEATQNNFDNVKTNISRTLSRLKDSGAIGNIKNPGAIRATSLWYDNTESYKPLSLDKGL